MPAEAATAVAKERIWKEHLDKCAHQERRHRVKDPVYRVNPFRMVKHDRPLAEPINRREQRFLDRDKAALAAIVKQLGPRAKELMEDGDDLGTSLPPIHEAKSALPVAESVSLRNSVVPPEEEDEGSRQVRTMLTRVHQTPVEKYSFPMTESQELGWIPPRRKAKEDGRFRFGLKNCEMTKFAGAHSLASKK